MAITTNVFGGAKVTANGGILGWTQDGVEITFNVHWKPVYNDIYGPMVGWDQQYFLTDATITCDFIYYDAGVLMDLTPGTIDGAAGTLAIQQDLTFPVVITPGTGTGMSGYTFPTCILDPSCVNKLGTVAATGKVIFHALLSQVTSGEGAVLYT